MYQQQQRHRQTTTTKTTTARRALTDGVEQTQQRQRRLVPLQVEGPPVAAPAAMRRTVHFFKQRACAVNLAKTLEAAGSKRHTDALAPRPPGPGLPEKPPPTRGFGGPLPNAAAGEAENRRCPMVAPELLPPPLLLSLALFFWPDSAAKISGRDWK